MLERQSLLLMASRRCSLECSYCPVVRAGPEMTLATARKAVDWLMTSRAPVLELGFMGGEPLARRDWMAKVVAYAHSRRAGRELQVFVPTNGLTLDDAAIKWLLKAGATALLGLDGNFAHCKSRFGSNRAAYAKAAAAIGRLREAGVEHAVNCVIGPEDVDSLAERLAALSALGAERVQVSYRAGIAWPQAAADAFARALTAAARLNRPELMNLRNEAEPMLLKNGIIIDEQGRAWLDNALFLEREFPSLRRSHELGRLGSLAPRDEVVVAPRSVLERAASAFGPGSEEGRTWLNNVALGQRVARAMAGVFAPRDGAEDPAVRRGVVEADFVEQDRFIKESMPWLDRLFVFVRGGCDFDCLFCKNKPAEDFQTLAELDAILSVNARVGRRRVALVGNEPMAHPRIADLVRLCRKSGFEEVEVMTSGMRLEALVPALAKAGVSSYAVALHGSRADVHDAVTRMPGSFAAVLRGITAAQAAGARVFVHTNACHANLADLPALEALARERGWPFSIHPLRPKDADGGMNVPYEAAAPGYAQLRDALAGQVESLTGFPACVARRIQGKTSCPGENVADSLKLYLLHQAFVKPPLCRDCADRERCVGTFEAHLRTRPDELRELCRS